LGHCDAGRWCAWWSVSKEFIRAAKVEGFISGVVCKVYEADEWFFPDIAEVDKFGLWFGH
jgi:hypothetical protein